MLKLIIILVSILSQPVYAKPDAVLSQLLRLRKDMDHSQAVRLSTKIKQLGKHFKVSPHLIIAIAMQESSLRPDNHRIEGGKVSDYGIMQVNVHSIRAYKLDATLIEWNHDYQLWAGVMILASKIKECTITYPGTAFACYHSATFPLHYAYVTAVNRYL